MNSITRRNIAATTVVPTVLSEQQTAAVAYNSFKNSLKAALLEKEPLISNGDGSSHRQQRNIVIASATQNGKTQEIIDIVKNSGKNSLCLLSCDNRSDQMIQLVQRLRRQGIEPLTCKDISFFKKGPKLTTKSFKKIKEYFENEERFVVVFLNNNSQCEIARKLAESILKYKDFGIKRFHMIHDEADLVNKSDNDKSITIKEGIAKVQIEWVAFFAALKPFEDLKYFKRIWVSATPENCSLIKEVKAKDVFVLPVHLNYRSSIKFTEWSTGDTEIMSKEVQRISRRQTSEIILYCSEYINAEQEKISYNLFERFKCPVITYNSAGIVAYFLGSGRGDDILKTFSICEAIECVDATYKGPIIIVGGALLSRGISFVGYSRQTPRTATVMFYSGSKSSTAVAIAQRIGRITGRSRPDISKRRLYCPEPIFECYTNYLKNQETIYAILRNPENREKLVSDILSVENPGLVKLGRNLDRPVLKKTNKTYDESCSDETDKDSGIVIIDRADSIMEGHVKRWMNPSARTDISKVFKEAFSNPGFRILTSEISKYIKEAGPLHVMTNPHSRNWHTVFSKDSQFHYIKPEAVAFANTLSNN